VYIYVEDFVEDPEVNAGALYSARNPKIPIHEILVSWGARVLFDDDIVMYTGEAHRGVCLCGSRGCMGSSFVQVQKEVPPDGPANEPGAPCATVPATLTF
jgi:hypothetical protein